MRYFLFAVLTVVTSLFFSGCAKNHADLAAISLTALPINPVPGTQVTFLATFANYGNDDAGACTWTVNELTVNGATVFGAVSGSLPALAQGASTTVSFTITQATAVAHSYQIIANSDNVVDESTYKNNSVALAMTWALPFDLQVAPLTVLPASPMVLQPMTLTASVTNAAGSPGTATGVTWSVTRDGVVNYVTGILPVAAPGAVLSVPVSLPAEAVSGVHTYQFIIDPGLKSTDTDITNNSQSIIVTVLPLAG